MRLLVIVLGVLLVMTSCQFMDREELVEIRLNKLRDEINFNDVDNYPNFGDCDEVAEKSEQFECFQQNFSAGLQSLVEGLNYATDKDIDESAKLIIKVDDLGFIELLDYRGSDDLVRELPQVQDDLRKLFEPISVKPAMKSGKQVAVRCSVQIEFKTK